MKRIDFETFDFPIRLEVGREQSDGGEPLGLSHEALLGFDASITEAFKTAVLEAMNTGILPRSVVLVGAFSISGVKRNAKAPT